MLRWLDSLVGRREVVVAVTVCGLFWLAACGNPSAPEGNLQVRLSVQRHEPYVFFLDENGTGDWQLLSERLGAGGWVVDSLWRVGFSVSAHEYRVHFSRIHRDRDGEPTRYDAEIDGRGFRYDALGQGGNGYDDPPGG